MLNIMEHETVASLVEDMIKQNFKVYSHQLSVTDRKVDIINIIFRNEEDTHEVNVKAEMDYHKDGIYINIVNVNIEKIW